MPVVSFQAPFRARVSRAMGRAGQGKGSARLTALTQSINFSHVKMLGKIKLKKKKNPHSEATEETRLFSTAYTPR